MHDEAAVMTELETRRWQDFSAHDKARLLAALAAHQEVLRAAAVEGVAADRHFLLAENARSVALALDVGVVNATVLPPWPALPAQVQAQLLRDVSRWAAVEMECRLDLADDDRNQSGLDENLEVLQSEARSEADRLDPDRKEHTRALDR